MTTCHLLLLAVGAVATDPVGLIAILHLGAVVLAAALKIVLVDGLVAAIVLHLSVMLGAHFEIWLVVKDFEFLCA